MLRFDRAFASSDLWLLVGGVLGSLLLGADRFVEEGGGDCPNSVMATAASNNASSWRLFASTGVDDSVFLRAASPGLVPSDDEAKEGKSPPP